MRDFTPEETYGSPHCDLADMDDQHIELTTIGADRGFARLLPEGDPWRVQLEQECDRREAKLNSELQFA